MENNITYTIQDIKKETENVFTLTLSYDGNLPLFKAGQFITVFFPETGHVEGKSYSISNIISPNSFTITIKSIGVFSNKLISLKAGDKLSASFPYGYFYTESDSSSLVLISGGIGIAPFKAMIQESLLKTPNRKIILFYSNKTQKDIIFKNEWGQLTEKYPETFKVNHYITQDYKNSNCVIPAQAGIQVLNTGFQIKFGMTTKDGRIPVADIIEQSKNLSDPEFFLCGTIPFVRDYWRGLKEGGVPEISIYTEAFF
ncbi:TPA: hypothetical protein DEP94_01240 [Candidatus Nomurabacteria bacterium]|nr:hypothetical protein [Candidatus Nomurabacteria bacterium]